MRRRPRSAWADFLLTIAVISLWFLLVKPAHALSARLTHDGGNGNARRAALSDSLELEEAAEHWGYTVFARRDDFTGDRTLTNAAAIISAGKRFGDHSFYLGLGAHFRQQKLNSKPVEAPAILPAAGFAWHHHSFRAEVSASEKMTRSGLAFLIRSAIPFELNADFEYLDSQPYRFSANVFAFVSRHGGLIAGYEPVSVRGRAGLWLKPMENLQLRSLTRFAPGSETFWEFSLGFSFDTAREPAAAETLRVAAVEKEPVTAKKPKTVPAFATLVKWGLTPVEALRFAREKEICNLSAGAQAALKRHHWECRA